MRMASNISRAVGRTSGEDGGSSTRKANKIIKFELFCDRAEESFRKVRRWIVSFLIQGMSRIQ